MFLTNLLVLAILFFLFFVPIFLTFKSFSFIFQKPTENLKKEKSQFMNIFEPLSILFTFIVCFLLFPFSSSLVETGSPLIMYAIGSEFIDGYTPLSFEHMPTAITIFFLGILSYCIIKSSSKKLAPIPYGICYSILLINILFFIMVITQILCLNSDSNTFNILPFSYTALNYFILILLYIEELKKSMDNFKKDNLANPRVYNNKYFNKLYIFFIKYSTKPMFFIVISFPVLIIIQLVLVLFGQQPDSFIQVFFDTSNYTYSKVIPPDPIIIPGDSHYLCTVSARGHEKVVKPLRAGLRGGKRILVNRQLLIANAFENILEQYTPKTHKAIRYIYDKYGYPLSKHINSKISADLTYFLMKPLEWIFLLVLYSVDKNPENRINIQYSELRKF